MQEDMRHASSHTLTLMRELVDFPLSELAHRKFNKILNIQYSDMKLYTYVNKMQKNIYMKNLVVKFTT